MNPTARHKMTCSGRDRKHAPPLEAGRGSFGIWHVYQLRYTAPPPKGTLTERVDPDHIGVNPDLIGVKYIKKDTCVAIV